MSVAPKKVSEKSLELNVGSELLDVIRWRWRMPRAYLRGLTQAEERREGVDFFAELSPSSRIFAFQFKAPKGQWGDALPYRFTIRRDQHDKLSVLARRWPWGVYYVLPFYVGPRKLRNEVPCLLKDTWLLRVADMAGTNVFGRNQTTTVYCCPRTALVNPEYTLLNPLEMELQSDAGIPVLGFADWYGGLRNLIDEPVQGRRRTNPWFSRGLRVAIVEP